MVPFIERGKTARDGRFEGGNWLLLAKFSLRHLPDFHVDISITSWGR